MLSLYEIFSSYIFPSNPVAGKIGSINLNISLIQWTALPFFGAKDESNTYRLAISICSVAVLSIITCIYPMLEIYDLVSIWGNLNQVTQNTSLSLTHFAGFFKIVNIFYRRKDIIRVIKQLKTMTQKYVVSEEQKIIFYSSEFENKISLIIFFTCVGFTGLLGMIFVISNPEQIAGKRFPYRVKMPEFIPFPLQVVYMGTSAILLALQVVGIDYLNVALMNQTRYQMKVLNIAFDRLSSADISDADAIQRMNSVIQHHNLILELKEDIESIFKFPVLLQFFASLSILALTGFQATVQSHSSSAVMIYFYCGCIFIELFVYCWFGNEVSEQNKTLAFSGYNSLWYSFSQKYKKSLIIFLINAQQPFIFTAGGFMNLSLTTFSRILSKSYTYIAVLRQIYAEK